LPNNTAVLSVSTYSSVSQPVCRDFQVCRGLYFGVPPSFKYLQEHIKTVPFPTFWPYFTPKCSAKHF